MHGPMNIKYCTGVAQNKKKKPPSPKKILKVWFAYLTSCKIHLNQQTQFNHTMLRYVLSQLPLLFTVNTNVFHDIISPLFCNLWSRLYYTFRPYTWIHLFLRRPRLHRTPSLFYVQGGSNMTGTVTGSFTHKQSRSYLNHIVLQHTAINSLYKTHRFCLKYLFYFLIIIFVTRFVLYYELGSMVIMEKPPDQL